jgi:hypothetical protein
VKDAAKCSVRVGAAFRGIQLVHYVMKTCMQKPKHGNKNFVSDDDDGGQKNMMMS